MIKVCVTKTSDWKFAEVRKYKDLEECVEQLLSKENFYDSSPSVVVSHPDDCIPKEMRDCDYVVEIYDYWRE